MAVITPSTDLYLLKVPIEIDNANQLTFSNATAQYNYFSSLQRTGETDFTYQRKDDVIRYPAHIDSILNYNYVMYRNDNYTDKWFYAFITDMRYINDGMTEITIKTDVWQTWQFDLEFKQSFVEREHVNDDTIGAHTLPEPVGAGEFRVDGGYGFGPAINSTNFRIGFQVSERPAGMYSLFPGSKTYFNTFSGLYVIIAKTVNDASNIIQYYTHDGKADAIRAIFMTLDAFVDKPSGSDGYFSHTLVAEDDTQWTVFVGKMVENTGIVSLGSDYKVYLPDPLSSTYTVKNNKLYTAPFTRFTITNNVGNSHEYNFEDFQLQTDSVGKYATFDLQGVGGQGGDIKMVPNNYKYRGVPYISAPQSYEYGVSATKLPICAWVNDYYVNWLTQNAINMEAGLAQSVNNLVSSFAGSLISGASGESTASIPLGAITSTVNTIIGDVASIKTAQILPDTTHGNPNNASLAFSLPNLYTVYTTYPKEEYLKVIDGFFSMYGYNVSELKVPNRTGRRNWNYVKTVGCAIHAYIPQEDCDEIKQMFNNGITLWHNASTFLDYSQNNDII